MSQLLLLIVINIGFGFAVGGIDNAAHLGGLFAGLWLGGLIPPSGVPTLATMWLRPATGPRPTSVGAAALATAAHADGPPRDDSAGADLAGRRGGRDRRHRRGPHRDPVRGSTFTSAGWWSPPRCRCRRRPWRRWSPGLPPPPHPRPSPRPRRPAPGRPAPRRSTAMSPERRIRSRTVPRTWARRSAIPRSRRNDDELLEHVDGRDVEVGGRAQVEDHGLRRRLGRTDGGHDLVLGDARVHERQRDVRAQDEDARHLARARVA